MQLIELNRNQARVRGIRFNEMIRMILWNKCQYLYQWMFDFREEKREKN